MKFMDIGGNFTVILNNLTIINAANSEMGYGGVINNTGHLLLNNINLINNTAIREGGGLYNFGTCIIENSNIINNTANYGGTITNYGRLNITNSTLINNVVRIDGGAIYNYDTTTIQNTILTDNSATNDGGAIYLQDGTVIIENSNITNNYAKNGGAISDHYGSLTIENSSIINNTAGNYGGAINNNGTVTINNTTIKDNINSHGGGVVLYNERGTCTIENTYIINNTSVQEYIGALITNYGNCMITNMTFINNTGTQGISSSSNTVITDSKFYNNTIRYNLFNSWYDNSSIRASNNMYIGNNLTSTTNITLEDTVLNNTNYNVIIPIYAPEIYNTTINTGNIIVVINNNEYRKYKVMNGITNITINLDDLSSTTDNTINYTYISDDNSYKSITGINNTIKVISHKTNITLDPINGLLGKNVTFKAHVNDINGTSINKGYVIFKVNEVTLKDTDNNPIKVNVTNGTAILTTIATWNNARNITAVYSGYSFHNSTRVTNITINLTRQNVTINMRINKELKPGDTLIVIVNVKDTDNRMVNTGNVFFKMNDKTLRDNYGKQIRINITNGQVTLYYNIPENYSAKQYNLTAIYTGNVYNREETTENFTLNKLNATINMTVISQDLKPGNQLITVANITYNDKIVTRGHVTFKLNDKTIQDSHGIQLTQNITNGQAILNYILPNNYSAKQYKLTAVFSGSNYAKTETTQNIILNKINTYLNSTNITITDKSLYIHTTIHNAKTGNIANERTQKVSVKLDQHTIIREVNITNGIININTTVNMKQGVHTVEILTSGNGIYNSCRQSITLKQY